MIASVTMQGHVWNWRNASSPSSASSSAFPVKLALPPNSPPAAAALSPAAGQQLLGGWPLTHLLQPQLQQGLHPGWVLTMQPLLVLAALSTAAYLLLRPACTAECQMLLLSVAAHNLRGVRGHKGTAFGNANVLKAVFTEETAVHWIQLMW